MSAEEKTLKQIDGIVREAVLWLDLAEKGSKEHGQIAHKYMESVIEQIFLYQSGKASGQCTIDPVTGEIKKP